MSIDQVADIFRFNMTALVIDAAKRREANVPNSAKSEPSESARKQAA